MNTELNGMPMNGTPMIGMPRHRAMNARLAEALGRHRPLIAVHRGLGTGSIPENTTAAIAAAFRSGADLVEIDVVRSVDGEFYLFHDGYELRQFGMQTDIRRLRSEEIAGLSYFEGTDRDGRPRGVVPLAEALRTFPEALFNVDRSWHHWETLLPYLDRFPEAAPGLVLKAPVREDLLELLSRHERKYPFIPMVDSEEAANALLSLGDRVNLVGLELLPDGPGHPLADPARVEGLRARNLLVFLDAINLGNGRALFLGWDDETSVLGDPDLGWGRLIAHGADIIQTDWPWLLADYRAGRPVRSTRTRP